MLEKIANLAFRGKKTIKDGKLGEEREHSCLKFILFAIPKAKKQKGTKRKAKEKGHERGVMNLSNTARYHRVILFFWHMSLSLVNSLEVHVLQVISQQSWIKLLFSFL